MFDLFLWADSYDEIMVAAIWKIISWLQPQMTTPVLRMASPSVNSKLIRDLIKSLHAVIGLVMQPTANEALACSLDRTIKIFLSSFSRVCMILQKKGSKPKWLTSYNYLCLLNLPDAIRKFGPLRNFWEGSTQGERFIQKVKPELSSGLRGKWQYRTMEKVMK